jgi:hypothetical protein
MDPSLTAPDKEMSKKKIVIFGGHKNNINSRRK